MPPPKTNKRSRHMNALWDCEIHDLATLRERLRASVLVSLDIESSSIGSRQHVSEIGLAILQVHENSPPFLPGLTQYYKGNGVETLTIRVRDRGLKPQYEDPEYRHGNKVHANEEDVTDITTKMLSKYEGNRILVGFDLAAEWRWISEMCPSLASLFSAWVDLQELVSQRRKQENFGPSTDIDRPGLTNTLRAFQVADWRRHKTQHCAANDALRSLIVLSGLVSHSPMTPLPPLGPKVHAFARLQARKSTHSFTVKITTQDGSKLPLYSPDSLRELFSKYSDLKAVAANWMTSQQKTEGVRFWRADFHTQESLERFILDIDGSTIDNTRVCVVR